MDLPGAFDQEAMLYWNAPSARNLIIRYHLLFSIVSAHPSLSSRKTINDAFSMTNACPVEQHLLQIWTAPSILVFCKALKTWLYPRHLSQVNRWALLILMVCKIDCLSLSMDSYVSCICLFNSGVRILVRQPVSHTSWATTVLTKIEKAFSYLASRLWIHSL